MPMKDWAKLPAATEQSSVDQKLYFVLSGSLTSEATCARTELSTSLSTDNANCVPTEQAQSTQPAYLSLNTT